MTRFFIASLAGLAAAGWSGAACAQAATDDAPIVVSASRIEQPRAETGQSVSVVERAELERRQTQVLSDLLQTLPGVTTARNGGPGAPTSLFIRGGDSSQTLVLVDGVRINDPSAPSGAFDFGALITGNIGRVEVLRGPNSVIWGSQAIGGVVAIETLEPTETLAVHGNAEYGYRDTAQGAINLSGRSGPLSASLGASYFRTDGISSLDERQGGAERDPFRSLALNGKVKIALSQALSLDVRGFFLDSRVAFDNPPADTPPVTDNQQFVGYAGINATLLDGRLTGRLAYTRTDIERDTSDATPGSFNPFQARGAIDRFEFQGVARPVEAVTLVFGAEQERSGSRTFFPAFDSAPDANRTRITSVYVQAIVRPAAGLTLTGGARHDDHQVFGGETSLGANIAYSPNDGRTVLRATYAEGFRAPALSELLSNFGNPDLQPETARSVDAGVEQALLGGALRASATYFRRTTRNLIAFSSDSFALENIASARAEGLELGLILSPTPALTVQAQYSLIDTTNRSRALDFFGNSSFGNDLARRPEDSLSLIADWQSPWGASLGATVLLVGDSFDNPANTVPLDSYVRADFRVSLPLGDRLAVYARVENAFDAAYQTAFGYGSPGRAGYLGVRFTP